MHTCTPHPLTHPPTTPPQVVIFVKSVARARELNRLLNECNFPSTTIHSAMRQEERLQVRRAALCLLRCAASTVRAALRRAVLWGLCVGTGR